MSGRGGVRSSARLSGDASASAAGAASPEEGSGAAHLPGPAVRVGLGRGRPLSSTSAAAERRARAAERAREVEDSPRVLRDKCRRLARALRNAKHLVVYTGAGISTAADIPDYRGPHGVWTRLQRGETVGRVEVSGARPTFTHMALSALWARGTLKFVASQNCDGLHVRAGLPRKALAELHGDMFAERCPRCRRVYLRAFDTTERTARHAHGTRRLCHACGAELHDSIVHFGERGRAAWPLNWAGALRHARRADVVLCLGSSLKVLRRYPRLWRMECPPRARPALYIVNLQWTPKDAGAALKINARCDTVMRHVARRLRLRVPRYRATADPLLAHAEPLAPPEAHTTRRPHLAPPPPSPAAPADSASDDWEPSSPSASDSDEELPLRSLAARLRAPHAPPPLPPPPPSDALCSFQVSLQSSEATILLRARHAPPPPPPPPPRTSDLRRFRMARCGPGGARSRPLTLNGHGAQPDDRRLTCSPDEEGYDSSKLMPVNGTTILGSRLRRLLQYEPRIETSDDSKGAAEDRRPEEPPLTRPEVKTEDLELKSDVKPYVRVDSIAQSTTRPKLEMKTEAKLEAKDEASSSESETGGSLAAAIIRRAVLLCRAELYPGLHTIIAPPPPPAPAPRADCAWCERHFGARRCLWYGAARAPALAARAWRRVRGRRVLCACCSARAASPPSPPRTPDDGGWYGKGYRKGRRRR